jgi:hypothetical protein
MKDINITTNAETITILEGKALEQMPPNKIAIDGDIKTVSNFLKVRKSQGEGLQQINKSKAIVLVNKTARTIELHLDPEDNYGAKVKGTLEISDELKQFGINTLQKFSRQELVKLIKMTRLFFENKDKHSDVLLAFQKIESSVNYSAKDGSDDRGNKERQFVKNVTTNAPMNFTLEISIFKGFNPQPLSVEICLDIEEGTAKFWLESVQLNELMQSSVDSIFETELKEAEGFVIINK